MTYSGAPSSVRALEQRIRNLEGTPQLALRRRIAMALVVVGQMLPDGAIKGGSAMALRYGRETRFTRDLDAARAKPMMRFRQDFETSLASGWAGFTGRLVEKAQPRPVGVPAAYVMQPFDVNLDYRGKSWCTVTFELGHNEIGDADEPDQRIADDLVRLFVDVGLEAPKAVPVLRADHQIAQKLHAVSAPDSERARDLVDLQLLSRDEELDLVQVRGTCERLFAYRGQHSWPPVIGADARWFSLYEVAREGVDVLVDVHAAVVWCNAFVAQIMCADGETQGLR